MRLKILQGRYTGPTDVENQLRLSAALARGRKAIPWQYRDNPGDLLAIIQHALALDIQVATALDNIVFSDAGVGGMRARLMHALILRAGHEIIPTHHDDRICRMVIRRGDGLRGGGAQWTLAEATNAGLLEKKGSPWHGYGPDMLWARCLSRLARRYCPDVILGFYVTDELDDLPDAELDSADMVTSLVDADGNPMVAPDVEAFLEDVDRNDEEQLRSRWRQAGQEGLMGAYAGTVDGVTLSVRDLLFAWLADAEGKSRQKAETVAALGQAPLDVNAIAAAATPTRHVSKACCASTEGDVHDRSCGTPEAREQWAARSTKPVPPPADGDDAPAGVGRMSCGCSSAAVLAADGQHQDGCSRPRRGGQ